MVLKFYEPVFQRLALRIDGNSRKIAFFFKNSSKITLFQKKILPSKMIGVKPIMAFGLLALTSFTIAQFSDDTPSLVLDNHSIITDKKTKNFIDQNLQDLFTMFRSYFEDNLDHCPECYTTFPRTGNDYKSVNKIDDDVYKVLQLTRLYQPANITKQAFEFLVQLETYSAFKNQCPNT